MFCIQNTNKWSKYQPTIIIPIAIICLKKIPKRGIQNTNWQVQNTKKYQFLVLWTLVFWSRPNISFVVFLYFTRNADTTLIWGVIIIYQTCLTFFYMGLQGRKTVIPDVDWSSQPDCRVWLATHILTLVCLLSQIQIHKYKYNFTNYNTQI